MCPIYTSIKVQQCRLNTLFFFFAVLSSIQIGIIVGTILSYLLHYRLPSSLPSSVAVTALVRCHHRSGASTNPGGCLTNQSSTCQHLSIHARLVCGVCLVRDVFQTLESLCNISI